MGRGRITGQRNRQTEEKKLGKKEKGGLHIDALLEK
jgi:hypothetical protein